jgi:hypothetical protein
MGEIVSNFRTRAFVRLMPSHASMGFSGDAVLHMHAALMQGEARMAQFNHQESVARDNGWRAERQ